MIFSIADVYWWVLIGMLKLSHTLIFPCGSMEDLIKGINLSDIKIARGGDRVYKEECIYSFDTPVSIAPPVLINSGCGF